MSLLLKATSGKGFIASAAPDAPVEGALAALSAATCRALRVFCHW
jgi:hypothetical protein